MLIDTSIKLDYRDVLLRPKRSDIFEHKRFDKTGKLQFSKKDSRSEVQLDRTFNFIHSKSQINTIPIIAANMDTVGTVEMFSALAQLNCMTAIHKHYERKQILDFMDRYAGSMAYFLSFGCREDDLKLMLSLKKSFHIRAICLDVANGYMQSFIQFVEITRENFPNSIIMAGNVATREITEQLILSGADIVKVGIGPGSVCLTRKMTGVGYPQLSAVIECAEAAHGLGGHICADGGCQEPGDIVKAFGGGADFVMLGGMLAGHTECGTVDDDGYMEFYGMSSEKAMNKHYGEFSSYRASEGRELKVKCRGSVTPYIKHDIFGGIRSAMTLIGAKRIKDIPKRTEFVLTRRALNPMFDKEDR